MEVAQNANLFGDIITLLFAAVMFLLSGVAIGFMVSRRRYLGPLTQLETEIRRIRNEQIRNRTFGDQVTTSEPSNTQQEEEPVFDTIAEWTQKIFDIIEPAAIIETDKSDSPSGDSDSIPVEELSVDLSTTSLDPVESAPAVAERAVAEPVVVEPLIAEPVVAEPVVAEPVIPSSQVIRPSNQSAPSTSTDFVQGSPASVFSLTSEQTRKLSDLEMNSFDVIARLRPAGIIQLATRIDVPIRSIEDVWIPEAEYRVQHVQAEYAASTSETFQTEGMEVSS